MGTGKQTKAVRLATPRLEIRLKPKFLMADSFLRSSKLIKFTIFMRFNEHNFIYMSRRHQDLFFFLLLNIPFFYVMKYQINLDIYYCN